VTLLNLDIVLRQLEEYAEGFQDGLARALEDEVQRIKTRAQELTPVGEGPNAGKLRDSAQVKAEQDSVEISFGGPPDIDYAVRVHEDLTVTHDDGQAKCLETATNEARPGMADRLGETAVATAKRRAGL